MIRIDLRFRIGAVESLKAVAIDLRAAAVNSASASAGKAADNAERNADTANEFYSAGDRANGDIHMRRCLKALDSCFGALS